MAGTLRQMTPWKLTEVIALTTLGLTIWLPAVLWMIFSVQAGRLVDLPAGLIGFVGPACAAAVGFLVLPQFASKPPQ